MSDGASITLQTASFNRALLNFSRYSRKGGQEILFDQARNFVRRVIAITPPSRGKANPAARKRGEGAIDADLRKIFSPADPDFIQRFEKFWGGREAKESFGHQGAAALGFIYTKVLERGQMSAWHEERRRKSDGKVMQINRDVTTGLRKRDLRGLDQGLVDQKSYEWFKRRVRGRVGILAGGWNRAALSLGYKPPAWIARHGDGRGDVSIVLGNSEFRIILSNDVKYASGVKGLVRAVQSALEQQAQAMQKRVDFYLAKAGKGAGFK